MSQQRNETVHAVQQDDQNRLDELERQFDNSETAQAVPKPGDKQNSIDSLEDKFQFSSAEKTFENESPLARRLGGIQGKRLMRNSSLSHIEGEEEVDFMRTKHGYVRTLQEITREREMYDRRFAKKKSFRQVIPVNTDTVSEVCRTVNMKLSLKKTNIDQLLNEYIFTEPIKNKGKISVADLIEIFTKEPFGLEENDAENLGRYLIEDNTMESIVYRPNMEAENQLVRSRARFIIGRIRIFTHEEELDLQKQLCNIMKKHGDGLYAQLILNGDVKRTLLVTKDQLYKGLQYLDLDLTKAQQEYYLLKLYERSGDVNKFKLDDCYKLFEQYGQHSS